MSIDINSVLKDLGTQILSEAKTNLGDLVKNLDPNDLKIIENAALRKAELLVAGMLGQDVTYDTMVIEETVALLADKSAAIVSATLKKTFLQVVSNVGGVVLKVAFSAIGL